MKKIGLTALGVAGACAACCAIPLTIPMIGALSASGLSLLAIDQCFLEPTGAAVVLVISLAAAIWTGTWYARLRRKRAAMAQSRTACSVPSSNGDGGCSCSKGAA